MANLDKALKWQTFAAAAMIGPAQCFEKGLTKRVFSTLPDFQSP
jgi:hypothetical protein